MFIKSGTQLGFEIAGVGLALPKSSYTTDELVAKLATEQGISLETDGAWVEGRTGIRERRLVEPKLGETVTKLAIEASEQALEMAGINAGSLDVVVASTYTADNRTPGMSADVLCGLGVERSGPVFDLNAACAGFVIALNCAIDSLTNSNAQNALVVGSEQLSKVTDWSDRKTAPLFGDGAGAFVVRKTPRLSGLLSYCVDTDTSGRKYLGCSADGNIYMDGKQVYKYAVPMLANTGAAALRAAGLSAEDIDLVVPHQANARIIESVAVRLGIDMERFAVSIGHHGNTSSASVPMAYAEAVKNGRVQKGDIVMFNSVGATMEDAALIFRT